MRLKTVFAIVLIFFCLTNSLYAQTSTEIILPEDVRTVTAGESIPFQISLIQAGEREVRDIRIRYHLKDLQNNVITYGEQTAALQVQSSIVATLHTPKNLKEGLYKISVEVREIDNDLIAATASENVFIQEIPVNGKIELQLLYTVGLYFIFFSFLIMVTILYLHNRTLQKELRYHHRLSIQDLTNYKRKNIE